MRASTRDASLVLGGKLLVSCLVLASGFRALSDDDYARIVIAQRFAESPSLDPSGTSWLPFPFWLNGTAMLLVGSSVTVARGVALLLGLASVLAIWLALRWLGARPLGAVLGALAAGMFPYSAWLGVAAVPELPSAALCLLGLASLAHDGTPRIIGGVALTAACLSRYEAWPVAAVFAVYCAKDARRARVHAGAALAALAGPLLWLLNGQLHHGSALFFVKRVSDYRRAVGAGNQATWDALLGFPSMLLRAEPELLAAALVVVVLALALGAGSVFRRHARVLAALAAALAFLIAGDLRDGAPTHHGERALLPIWVGLAALGGDAFSEAWQRARGSAKVLLLAMPGLAMAPMAGIARPWYSRRDAFIDRSSEVAIGQAARALDAASGRLAIDSRDFGFYAVMAGFGAPSRAEPLDEHDPREPRAPDPFAAPGGLRARLAAARADWLVVEVEHLGAARELGRVVRQEGKYALIALAR